LDKFGQNILCIPKIACLYTYELRYDHYLQGAFRFAQTIVLDEFHEDVWFLSPQRENIFHSKNILELFINGIDWYLFDDVQFYFRPIETSLYRYKKHAMQKTNHL